MPKSWNNESDEEQGDNHDNFNRTVSNDRKVIVDRSKSRSSSVDDKPTFNSKSRANNQNPEPCNCIGIFGLARETDEKTLWEIFEKFGTINSVKLIMDKFQNTSLGFAFINYAELDSATTAIKEANGIELDGKKIRVDYSITKKAHTPTPGGYKGKLTNRRNFGNDNFNIRRGGKRNFDERSRSRSRPRSHYPTKSFDRNYSPDHNERFSRSAYGHDRSRYSPKRTEYNRYSPRRSDQNRYSPRRSDQGRFSPPRKHDYSRYSPRKPEPSRYSPPRRQETSKYVTSRRPESSRYSPPPPRRTEPSRYSPPRRTEPSRYSPQRRPEPSRYSPMKRTGASRYSPPRREDPMRYESSKTEVIRYEQHRYSPRTEKTRYPVVNQWDRNPIKRSSPSKDDFIPYSINGNVNKSISNGAKRYGTLSQFNGKHSPDDNFNRKCYQVDNYFSNSRNN